MTPIGFERPLDIGKTQKEQFFLRGADPDAELQLRGGVTLCLHQIPFKRFSQITDSISSL
jgi:hypothetical protein